MSVSDALTGDTSPVTDQHDWASLETWLCRAVPEVTGPLRVEQFTGGHANLTSCVAMGGTELVMRRPPFGDIAPGAHDMAREYRVLAGLGPRFDRAPRALAFCDDVAVIGATFLVIERRRGLIVRDHLPDGLADLPDVERRISMALVDALADLHSIDPEDVGLERLGQPDGFVERQLAGWHDRWHRIPRADGPQFDEVHERLRSTQPPSGRVSIVHNDYKLNNAMFTPGEPDWVSSIFDWDMTTLGDPLIDLGTLLGYWKSPVDTAIVCADVFHVVKLVGDALDNLRRDLWQQLRRLPDDRWAKDFKGSRWALLKNPEDLTERQAEQLARIRRTKGGIWRAYEMKEQFRAIVGGDLNRTQAAELLDRWCARAQRSRLSPFVKAARTMRQRRDLILNAIEHGISNGRVEGLNNTVRLIVRRGYGFHTADAALALVMLGAGPINLQLPHEHQPAQTAA